MYDVCVCNLPAFKVCRHLSFFSNFKVGRGEKQYPNAVSKETRVRVVSLGAAVRAANDMGAPPSLGTSWP